MTRRADTRSGLTRSIEPVRSGRTSCRSCSQDNERTAKIRMQQEAAEAIAIQGSSRYRHLISGHTFTLKEQVVAPYAGSASHDGKYVLTSVSHTGRMSGSYRSGDAQEVLYENSFTCIPAELPYRPPRVTPQADHRGDANRNGRRSSKRGDLLR